MSTTTFLLRSRPVALRAGAALLLGAGLFVGAAAPASAQQITEGCPPVPANYTVDDHSLDPVSLGTPANPHFVVGGSNVFTIGTRFNDVIEGNANADIICALAGDDAVKGNAGDDVIYGLNGIDTLSGNEAADTLLGGLDGDFLYGDGPTPTQFDAADDLKGGKGDDDLFGGDQEDRMLGNAGFDFADGEGGQGDCVDVFEDPATNDCY